MISLNFLYFTLCPPTSALWDIGIGAGPIHTDCLVIAVFSFASGGAQMHDLKFVPMDLAMRVNGRSWLF